MQRPSQQPVTPIDGRPRLRQVVVRGHVGPTLQTFGVRSWRRPLLIDGALLLIVAFTILTFTASYLARERMFYFSDWGNYHSTTAALASHYKERFATSPLHATWELLRETWVSTLYDYNLLHALPISPLLVVFGDSRLTYISSIALLYLLPFSLSIGAVASRLVPSQPRLAFWAAVILMFLTPVIDSPTLHGFPDAGAGALLVFSLYIYTGQRPNADYRYMGLVGGLIGLAVLFRRHFIYPATALLIVLAVDMICTIVIQCGSRRRLRISHLAQRSGPLVALLGGVGLTIVVLGAPFVYRFLTTDFTSIYASYEAAPSQVLRWLGAWYGWLAWMAAALGFALGWVTRTVSRQVAWLVLLWSACSALLWTVQARQSGEHYGLQFAPFMVLGLLALILTVWRQRRGLPRMVALAAIFGYLLANLFVGFGGESSVVAAPLRPLLSAPAGPMVLEQYDDTVRVVDWLRGVVAADGNILVAAPTVLDEGLLSAAEHELYGSGAFLHFMFAPVVDSRDWYPLDILFATDYVVVALSPPKEPVQQVQKVLVDAFAESWEIANDFKKLPTRYTGMDGLELEIYQRLRPTSPETAVATLARMRSAIGVRPGGQQDWLILSRPPTQWSYRERYNRYEFRNEGDAGGSATMALYLPRSGEPDEAVGRLEYAGGGCARPELSLWAVSTRRTPSDRTTVPVNEEGRFSVSLGPGAPDGPYSILEVSSPRDDAAATGYCGLRMELSRPPQSRTWVANVVDRIADQLRTRLR